MKSISLFLTAALFIHACKTNPKTTESAVPEKSLLLYVGTYTEKESHVDGKAEGIYIYRMNSGTGELTYVNTSPFTTNPSFIDISHDGRFLYAVNETGGDTNDGYVSAFRLINYEQPEFINLVSSAGDYPCYIEAGKNGKFVLIANYGSGSIAYLPVREDGSLQKASTIHFHEGSGITSRQETAHAHCIRVSPDGKFAYSSDLGTDRIYIYRMTEARPELTGEYKSAAGAGPRHLAFHPRANYVYSINELNGTIDCMLRDTLTGELAHFQTISTVGDKPDYDAGSADIHITPSGDFLYATNRGSFNNIASYRIDAGTGKLTLSGIQPVNGVAPRNFAIDPTGKFVLIANQNSNQIITFKIDTVSGKLIDTGIHTDVPTPVCIKFLPDHLN